MSIPDVLVQSTIGLALVFLVLVILMVIIYLMSAIFKAVDHRKKPATATASAAAISAPQSAVALPGRGSCGEVKLYDVPDATAAMLMAIVADEMGVPLNELRFISIKEVEDESK